MSENSARLKYLIQQYSNNGVTAIEEQELFTLISETGNEEFENVLTECFEEQEPVVDHIRRDRLFGEILHYVYDDKGQNAIVKEIYPPKVVRGSLWKRLVAAAAVLVAIVSVTYLLTTRNNKLEEISKTQQPASNQDVAAPNKAKATITLADGRIVSLDSLASGTLANQGNVIVNKTADGKIVYSALRQAQGDMQYNTLTNPRGSLVIDMTLADGSHVWLNSGSSITYPVSFVGNERKVSMTGEAYFEIQPLTPKGGQGKVPFLVEANGTTTEVLGTHFNVNSYSDEANVKVTLVEGSVRVTKGSLSGLLKPGQQAQVSTEVKIVKDVDVDAVMAWRNGLFEFNNTELPVIIRQVARWYDIEVVYEGKPTNAKFGGGLSRKLPMSKVLKLLEANGLKFKVEGKKVTVIY